VRTLLVLAGVGQLALSLVSLAIPRVLRWREETAKLRPLTRQVFWTYAGYILGFHVAFGLLSALAPQWLLARTPLARAVAGFIAVYWATRLALQFLCFDRSEKPPGAAGSLAEAALVALFVYLAAVYAAVALSG
jgi:hypothetical protein